MKKRGLFVVLVLLLFIFVSCGTKQTEEKTSSVTNKNGKALVVYFSATGTTKKVAEDIRDILDSDIFEIVPKEKYTSSDLDWTNSSSRTSIEKNDPNLSVELEKAKVDNFDEYSVVFIGAPIWWGNTSWVLNEFVKGNDFRDKTVVVFCTASSSGIGNSTKTLSEMANGGEWINGVRFYRNTQKSEIEAWLKQLGF